MNKLSIEELKSLREAYYGMQYEKIVAVLDELIAIRELKGEQVPVAVVDIQHGRTDGNLFALTLTKAGHALKDDVYELFTAPQKPVVLPKSFVMAKLGPNVPEIKCYSVQSVIAAIEAAGGWVCTSDERLMQDMSGIVKDGE